MLYRLGHPVRTFQLQSGVDFAQLSEDEQVPTHQVITFKKALYIYHEGEIWRYNHASQRMLNSWLGQLAQTADDTNYNEWEKTDLVPGLMLTEDDELIIDPTWVEEEYGSEAPDATLCDQTTGASGDDCG